MRQLLLLGEEVTATAGEGEEMAAAPGTFAPHSMQNLSPGDKVNLHLRQLLPAGLGADAGRAAATGGATLVPQPKQNLVVGVSMALHLVHDALVLAGF